MNGPDRDFVGDGRRGITVRRPHHARVPPSTSASTTKRAPSTRAPGPATVATKGHRSWATAAAIRDLANESMFEYGSRAGIWRLQAMFDELGIGVMFFGCAVAFELNPEVASYIREAGHDVCCHGLRWEDVSQLDRDTERAHLHEAVGVDHRDLRFPTGGLVRQGPAVAADPANCCSRKAGSCTTRTRLPTTAVLRGGDRTAASVIPYTFVTNDSRYLPGQGLRQPHRLPGQLPAGVRRVVARRRRAVPSLLTIGLHPRWIGQPARASALREFLEHVLTHERVWFARREEVARWWIAHHDSFS